MVPNTIRECFCPIFFTFEGDSSTQIGFQELNNRWYLFTPLATSSSWVRCGFLDYVRPFTLQFIIYHYFLDVFATTNRSSGLRRIYSQKLLLWQQQENKKLRNSWLLPSTSPLRVLILRHSGELYRSRNSRRLVGPELSNMVDSEIRHVQILSQKCSRSLLSSSHEGFMQLKCERSALSLPALLLLIVPRVNTWKECCNPPSNLWHGSGSTPKRNREVYSRVSRAYRR